MEYHKIEHGYL